MKITGQHSLFEASESFEGHMTFNGKPVFNKDGFLMTAKEFKSKQLYILKPIRHGYQLIECDEK
jgi:hypothetical protein